jgi:molybdate transport system substrate-binding protein
MWISPAVVVIALAVASITASACKREPRALLVHAGAGQRASLDAIAARFLTKNPGARVDFSYKGSGFFIADVTASHVGDLYMPGEEYYLLQAVQKGFIAEYDPKQDIAAHFITVIMTARGNPKNIRSVEDFARAGVRVGLADPEAAAVGLWHEKIFTRAGIWDDVKKNATMHAKCIAELGNAIQLGAIDATIVWATTALLYLKDAEIVPLAPRFRGLVRLPVATLKFSKQPDLAGKLKTFILSPEAREIFREHAYGIDVGAKDADGFCADGGKATDEDMKWLVEAARVAKDPALPASAATVGPLVAEVMRQRTTRR